MITNFWKCQVASKKVTQIILVTLPTSGANIMLYWCDELIVGCCEDSIPYHTIWFEPPGPMTVYQRGIPATIPILQLLQLNEIELIW